MAHLESLVVLDAAGRSGAALAFGFERAGYRVYATRDPDDALAMAQTRVPQLIVVTVDGGDALSFVGRLRQEAPTRELPVVAVGEPGSREEALRAGVDEFVTRPAFIRDILTLSRLAVAVRQDGDDGGVVGLLEDYGLYFLVRALAVAGRSGVIELERGRRLGEVHVAKGTVVAAKVGRMSGIAGFHHLLLWGEASMSLRFESPTGERRISATVDELLESGAHFSHEFEELSARVGGPQAVYAHEPRRAAEARAQIPAEVMVLVKQYDGHKPLIDIIEDSPFKPFDTIKITYRLAELGAIAKRETRATTPLSERLAVRDWLLGASEEPRERPPAQGAAAGLTEAGRRAAEAYAAEAAARAAERSPAADILDDSAALRAAAAAPAPPTKPPVKADLKAANTRPAAPAAPAGRATAATTPTAPVTAATKKSGARKEAARRESATGHAAAPRPAAKSPAAPKKEPSKREAPSRAAAKKESPNIGKLSAHAAAHAHPKEPVFEAFEEEFFARESEHLRPSSAETFDDLEPTDPRRRLSGRRDWFGLKKK